MTDKTTKRLNRRDVLAGAAAGMAALQITMPGKAHAAGYPGRPITVVVMYAAGGGTDVVMRKLAEEMAAARGWTINVINKPGAVGGVATQYVGAARSDGYTLLGAANYNRFVRVLGHADFVPWKDWHFFRAGGSIASWSVRADSPFQTMQDVIDAAAARPGEVTISTSGTGGVWHELAMIVSDLAGVTLKYVPYKGGKPATLAGLQGETDIAGGGVHEHVDLVRAGEMRCLAQTGDVDIDLGDGKVMPSIGNLLPATKPILPLGTQYNLIVKRDLPADVLQELSSAFLEAANSPGYTEMLRSKYFVSNVKIGEAADREAAYVEAVTVQTFNKYADQIGAPVKSAADLGLPAPADFEGWWPPEGYVAPPIDSVG